VHVYHDNSEEIKHGNEYDNVNVSGLCRIDLLRWELASANTYTDTLITNYLKG